MSYKLYLKLSLDADIMFMYLKYHIFNDQCYSIMSGAIMAFDHVHLKLSLSNDGLIPAWVILSHQSRLFYIKSGISNCLPRPPPPLSAIWDVSFCICTISLYRQGHTTTESFQSRPTCLKLFSLCFRSWCEQPLKLSTCLDVFGELWPSGLF